MVTHSGRRLPTPYASAAATAPWGCTLGPAVGLTLRTISKALRTQSSLWLGLRILHAEMLLRARRILRHATHRKWHRLSGQRSFLMRYASTCKAAERSDGRADAHASVPCVRCVALRCVALRCVRVKEEEEGALRTNETERLLPCWQCTRTRPSSESSRAAATKSTTGSKWP